MKRLFTFALIGGGATAIHYLISYALIEYGERPPVEASTIGYAVSAVCNYIANAKFTFKIRSQHQLHFPRFLCVAGFGWLLNGAGLWALISYGMHPYAAQPAVTALVMLSSYTLNARWAMRA